MEIYIMILVSVIIGFIMGRQTVRPPEQPYKEITMPNPVKMYKDHQQKVEENKELEKYTTIMENIENYDGTGAYQKDVPL